MRTFFFSPKGFWPPGYSIVRIITGAFLLYHGLEVFDLNKMNEYGKWMSEAHFPWPYLMAWLGKGSEFVGGGLLIVGLFTRIASLLLIVTMTGIIFGLGHGKVFTDDQHPMLFILLGLIFFFSGPGVWSLDEKRNEERSL